MIGGGPELGQIASSAIQEGRRYTLETQLTRMMGILARDCPIRSLLSHSLPKPHTAVSFGHEVSVARSVNCSSEQADHLLEKLLRLHTAYWQASSGHGPVARPAALLCGRCFGRAQLVPGSPSHGQLFCLHQIRLTAGCAPLIPFAE